MPAVTDDELRDTYRGTIDALYGYISRRCGGDRQLAEDITQDTWLRAVRAWHCKGLPREPVAWLKTVARNLLSNQFRTAQPVALDGVSPAHLLTALDDGRAHESAEVAVVLNRALARLPRDQTELIEAFHYERHKVAQIAKTFGISERAVEGRLRRARENLRKELETALGADGALR